jgi:hypothetical protein
VKVDLRKPTIVIAGAFNPAIFQPAWIANILYEIPEGEDVEGVFVRNLADQTTVPYIKRVGVLAEMHRLSVFVDSLDAPTVMIAEGIVRTLAGALPHTPVGGLGVNFHFEESDVDAAIVDMLKAQDKPEKIGPVLQNEVATAIEIGDSALNLSRSIQDGVLSVRFNYHRTVDVMSGVADLDLNIGEAFVRSREILKSLYDLSADDDEIDYYKALAQG